jgi:hypothetical protein
MIGPKEKDFHKQTSDPPCALKNKSNFRHLPKYISYRAALLREKLVLTYLLGLLSMILVGYFAISRMEIASLYKQLRVKEYILAPGVLDFTTATPQSVPDSYVNDAVNDFLSTLGNINANIITEQYESLKRFMSPELKIQFSADAKEWIQQTKHEDLAQIFRVKSKKIISNTDGNYSITAFVRADFYASGQSLGHEDQVVEMTIKLVPPDREKRWYLQITALSWSKLESFQTRNTISKPQK